MERDRRTLNSWCYKLDIEWDFSWLNIWIANIFLFFFSVLFFHCPFFSCWLLCDLWIFQRSKYNENSKLKSNKSRNNSNNNINNAVTWISHKPTKNYYYIERYCYLLVSCDESNLKLNSIYRKPILRLTYVFFLLFSSITIYYLQQNKY